MAAEDTQLLLQDLHLHLVGPEQRLVVVLACSIRHNPAAQAHRHQEEKKTPTHPHTNLQSHQLLARGLLLFRQRLLGEQLCLAEQIVLFLECIGCQYMLVDKDLALGCRPLRIKDHLQLR
jgi:hypothetical protein